MPKRLCVFAWTAPNPDYPEYVSINREDDGRLTITVRGPKRKPGEDNDAPFDMPGHTTCMTLPEDEVDALAAAIAGRNGDAVGIRYTLNDVKCLLIGHTSMSYEGMAKLAGYEPSFTPTVVVSYPDGTGLAPRHGEEFEIKDDTIIDVALCNRA